MQKGIHCKGTKRRKIVYFLAFEEFFEEQ